MVKITLTAEQSAQLEPLLLQACMADGTVFCQAQRGAFPDHGQATIGCHFIPGESSNRLRAFLAKERARLDGEPAPKAAKTPRKARRKEPAP